MGVFDVQRPTCPALLEVLCGSYKVEGEVVYKLAVVFLMRSAKVLPLDDYGYILIYQLLYTFRRRPSLGLPTPPLVLKEISQSF